MLGEQFFFFESKGSWSSRRTTRVMIFDRDGFECTLETIVSGDSRSNLCLLIFHSSRRGEEIIRKYS